MKLTEVKEAIQATQLEIYDLEDEGNLDIAKLRKEYLTHLLAGRQRIEYWKEARRLMDEDKLLQAIQDLKLQIEALLERYKDATDPQSKLKLERRLTPIRYKHDQFTQHYQRFNKTNQAIRRLINQMED